ncbi:conjugal transfer protein TraF [Vibrio sp. SCSIO 43136]|uniref:conjugal transfer protein TraF n=1 Tax=Vibrio sp. SCSIO 43136 TaxID=2819101 RepID=UPI0020753161|nr:conjugal transfer protein TraF [Vibrio sp. SCSIO 43136]USD68230.1 conjugal transfer protein TraF [Vibrio sp. SCSIO 43136]
MKKIGLTTSIALALSATGANAANYSVDGRGDAMGGTGVVSGDFLSAPFYNPALAALYRRNDNSGMIIPAVGLAYEDQGDMLDTITSLADTTITDPAEADALLEKLNNGQLSFDIGIAAAFAIPNSFLSMNVYGKAYTESFATPIIQTTGSSEDKVNNAELGILSVGVTELGLTMAKYYTLFGQHTSFGITPKIQRVYSLNTIQKMSDFSFDIFNSATGETAFNMDAGAVWFYGPWRVGVSAMNIFGRDIETNSATSAAMGGDVSYTYKLQPNYTVGAGLVGDYYAFSIDYDLVEREKFVGVNDNEQMLRAGLELDLMRQIQFRAGYRYNLAHEDNEGTMTAGIGLTPLGIITMDIGASYTNSKSMGIYLNFLGNY